MKMAYETERLILKVLTGSSCNDVLQFYNKNQELFERYEPARPSNFYTKSYQKSSLNYEYTCFSQGTGIRFWVYKKCDPDSIIGTISFLNIQRNAYMNCHVGYKFDAGHHHQGYAQESLTKGVNFIFKEFDLHRIIAYIMPSNIPSKRLIERLGFTYEGIAYQNIFINNKWEDHEQYSLINHSHSSYNNRYQ